MIIKTPLGLGDAVYCYPIVKYLQKKYANSSMIVVTQYPIIFKSLGVTCVTQAPFSIDFDLRYTHLRSSSDNQYQDLLTSAQLPFIPFELDWPHGFTENFRELLADLILKVCDSKKKLCVIKEPCLAHMHKRKNDASIVPNVKEMQQWVNENKNKYFFVSVGHHEVFNGRLEDINIDLNDKMSVQDLITLCAMSDTIATQVGHLVPIAQAFNKPLKLFMPEKITDHRLINITKEKIRIQGIGNEI